MFKHLGLVVLSVCLLSWGACGDDDSQNQNDAAVQQDADNQDDGQVQDDAEVQPDAAPTTEGCTGESPESPVGLGGCCNINSDCSVGVCVGGWCSKYCTDDADCGVTVAGPFPTGTAMHCNQTQLAFANFCLPGSLGDCAGENDSACPAGEVCIGAWNDDTTSLSEAFRGICVTAIGQTGVLAAGESTVGSANPELYQCESPTFQFYGYNGRRCTEACDPTNPVDTCPTNMECSEVWASPAGASVLSGVGICVGQTCGRLEFTGDDENDVRIPGRNDECPTGEVCEPTGMNGVDGDILTHYCAVSDPSLGQIGDDCEHAAKFDMGCDNWVYCIQDAAQYTTAGEFCSDDDQCDVDEVCATHNSLPSRCAPKPDPGFCSAPCRTDADCPLVDGDPSLCASGAWGMASGDDGYVTYCLAWRLISDDAPVVCDTNADCDTDLGIGCVVISDFNGTRHCLPHITQDATGTDCSTNGVADCQTNEACIEAEDATTFLCTTVQVFGDPCDATDMNRCVGGSCLDIDWEADDGGAPTNTYCAGWCQSNADCGTNQVCDWELMNENDPATDADDVGGGHCRPMGVRSGAGCTVVGDCSNGDGCDTTTGRCYTTTAAWGDACTEHSDCPQYGLCDAGVTGGMCYRPGCDSGNGNADCDATGACSDALPIGMCLEDCTGTADCSRSADGFTCVGGACLAP